MSLAPGRIRRIYVGYLEHYEGCEEGSCEIPIFASEQHLLNAAGGDGEEEESKRKRNQKPKVVGDQGCWLMERMRRVRMLALPGWKL